LNGENPILEDEKFVEQVSKESLLEMYSKLNPTQQPLIFRNGDKEAADKRMAEQFRKEFLEAMENAAAA
jgi:hypothetical protein